VAVKADYPLAYESPDHLHPHGTKDLSTRKVFVVKITKLLKKIFSGQQLAFLDLGCAAGLLVKDFKDYGYLAVGLEGSDYNLKRQLKYWDSLGNTNLFTCDITKPFGINRRFHLITAWEVMEHMPTEALNAVFSNIEKHLVAGGYFIASTSSFSDKTGGVELHLTQWPNHQWLKWIAENRPGLAPVKIPLKYYEMVRYGENSFLIYKKL
jgi:2-polyprenyl-3-methyl-5-hydroxy-6-metoxy-1,4-benzoquinol methylase